MKRSKKVMMKLLLCLCLAFGFANVAMIQAKAKTLKEAGDFEYWENGDGKTVTIVGPLKKGASQRKSITKVVIPAKIDGKKVTALAGRAFAECKNLKTVVIESGIKSIGNDAFDECYKLTSITIPASVKKIPVPPKSGIGMWLNLCSKNLVVITTQGSYAEKYFKKYSLYLGGKFVNDSNTGHFEGSVYKKAKVVSVAKVKNLKAKTDMTSMVLTWKKTKKMSGYQIQYSTDAAFANVQTKTVKASKTKYTLKNLEMGTTYYVRIRAYKTYKTSKGKKVKAYGEWTTLSKATLSQMAE